MVVPAYGVQELAGLGWVIVLLVIGQAQLLFTVMTAISVQPWLVVHTRLYVPAAEKPVTVVVGLVGAVIVAVPALPAPMVQVPVPVAAIVAVPVL